MLKKAHKVLILRFSSIGDIVLTTPIIRCLYEQVGCEIHYLTKSQYVDLLSHSPYISQVHTFTKSLSDIKAPLVHENYDHIIDLHKNLRSKRIISMLGKPHTDFDKANIKKWLMVYVKRRKPITHIVDRYFEALPIDNDGLGLDFFISQDLEKEFANKFETIIRSPYTIINLGATHRTKRIPIAKIKDILGQDHQRIILIGGSDVVQESKNIADQHRVTNLVGQMSLLESAYLIKRAQMMITGDSGMMHIGAAYKLPMITLWGSTVPALGMSPYYGAQAVDHFCHEVTSLGCRPCTKIGRSECPKGHYKCMNDLSVQAINQSVNQLLD